MRHRPNFFLLGAPKCGTSAMRSYLASHPEVFFSIPDEPGYFDRKFRYVNLEECAYQTLEDYLTLYNGVDSNQHRAIGEGSVYMMYSKDVLDEIMRLSPKAKFIIMLRNPYRAAISMHGENLKSYSLGREPKFNFSEAWADLENRNVREIAGVHPLRFRYDILFSYNRHVQVAKEIIEERNLKVILYDDFKADNLLVAKAVYEYLGVSKDFEPAISITNERSQARSNSITKMVSWAAMKSRRYKVLRPLRGKGLTLNRFTQEKLSKPDISKELMHDMRRVYHDDICALQGTLGRDLSGWINTDLTDSAG